MGKKVKEGDIYEIRTPKGFAYFQFTNKNSVLGHLIRVLPGIFQNQPSSFSQLNEKKELFYLYFPLGAALNRGIVKFVANEVIPESARKIPVMRKPGKISSNGKVMNWIICDGDKKLQVNNLSDEQKRLSLEAIWNDTLLIERICSNWMPENEV